MTQRANDNARMDCGSCVHFGIVDRRPRCLHPERQQGSFFWSKFLYRESEPNCFNDEVKRAVGWQEEK